MKVTRVQGAPPRSSPMHSADDGRARQGGELCGDSRAGTSGGGTALQARPQVGAREEQGEQLIPDSTLGNLTEMTNVLPLHPVSSFSEIKKRQLE